MDVLQYIYKPITAGGYHITILYQPENGNTQYFSAYASGYAGTPPGVSQGLSDIVNAAEAVKNGTPSPLGVIKYETGIVPFDGLPDVTYDLLTQTPYKQEVVATGANLSAQWQKILSCGQEIANQNLPYSTLTQNSNSVAYTCVLAAGITPPEPDGVFGDHWTPASDTRLPTSYGPAQNHNNTEIKTDSFGVRQVTVKDTTGATFNLQENGAQVTTRYSNNSNKGVMGKFNTYNIATGELLGSGAVYNDSSSLTGLFGTTDFLSSSTDSASNVFSKNTAKDKFGTIAGIRQAVGALSANERWGGQTFATASTNLGSYLGNLNYVDPSTIYQNTLVNSFSFNTNFGSYIPPITYQPGGNGSVYIGPPITIWIGKPVVLDLNQNGVELISLDESRALFDMSGTGFRQRTAWVAPSDALLAIDYNNDGVIKERKEINFVDWTNNPNLTDMEALALAFDTNKDGRLDSADAGFSKFRVWQDKNADGVSDAGELLTLTQAGIKSIDLKTTKMNWSSGANSISGLGSYTKLDGSQGLLSDSAFGHESAGWKAEVVNGIQRVTNERGDKYGVAGSTGNFVVSLNTEGLNGAIGGAGADSMTTSGAIPVFMQGNAGNDSLVGGDGDDWLEGGSGSDSISGGAGDDTIIVDSEENLTNISGGAGFDIIAFEGNANFNIQLNLTNGFESAIGGAGNDNISVQSTIRIPQYWLQGGTYPVYIEKWTDLPLFINSIISGGTGNDTITGGVGNDIIEGGSGNDVLNGDWGNDTYLFGFGDGKDSINDKLSTTWNYGSQSILAGGAFPTFYNGSHGVGVEEGNIWSNYTGNNSGLYNQSRNSDVIKMTKGVLAADVVMEKPYSIPTAPNYDLLIGLRQDKSFDSVTQLDDYLTLKNYQAYSRYLIRYQPTRDAYGNVTNVPVYGYYQLSKIESIEFSDGSKLLIDNWFQGTLGASKSDTLTGNASDNLLNGLSGADIMSGGLGNDIYVVDNTNDAVIESVGQGNDSVQTFVTLNAELWANVENLTLVGSDNINGIGNSLNNVITGNVGNNILNGDAGTDTLVGGEGNDTYIVDTTTDTITEATSGGTDIVQSSVTYTLGANSNLENLTLTGTSAINGTGNTLNNVITGNSAANLLDGGTGTDTLIGGDGNDTYIVDTTTDSIIETATGGIDTVQSSLTYTLSATSNLENLTLTGTGAINGTGNDLSNTLIGNSGNNILSGGFGSDTLIGGAGNDTYVVAQSNIYAASASEVGTDVIVDSDLTAGNVDTVEVGYENLLWGEEYSNAYGSYTFYLDVNRRLTNNGYDNLEISAEGSYITDSPYDSREYFGGFLIQDQFKGTPKIEQIKFSSTGEILTMQNYLTRVGYNFIGSDNNDTMYGTSGVKSMNGGLGNDYIYGNEASNSLYGGAGDDTLSGGAGNDYLYGGEGSDTYVFSRGDGVDVAYDEYYSGGGGSFESQTIRVNANSNEVNLTRTANLFAWGSQPAQNSNLVVEFINNSADRLTFNSWWSADSSNANRKIVFNDKTINLDEIEMALTFKPSTTGADLRYGSNRNDTISGSSGNDILIGMGGADLLNGDSGQDRLYGGLGNDQLYGGLDSDYLYGEEGNDSLYGGDGHDQLVGGDGDDSLYGGDGDDTMDGGLGADYLDGGAGWNTYYVDNVGDVIIGDGAIVSDLQTYTLANGKTHSLNLRNGLNGIGNAEANVIVGNSSSNFIVGNGGNDSLYSGERYHGEGYDILQGGEGNDQLDRDVNGWYSVGGLGNALLDGGTGNDTIYSRYLGLENQGGNDVLIGGKGNDIIYASRVGDGIPGEESTDPYYMGMTGNDVVLFNLGDGQDVLYAGEGPKLTLSLGKITSYDQLSLTKTGNDLILNVSPTDKIAFFDWYANNSAVNTKSVANLQVIAESLAGFSNQSTNSLRNNNIENFNFASLVAAFDAQGSVANWQLTESRLTAHMKTGSNTAAIGGDLAYQYGRTGSLAGMGLNATQAVLSNANFGQAAQTFSTALIGSNEAIKLS